ncbi:hypothetical protein [Dickeya dadantii]|nr:hypothetical protein [Dickeya dadantii]
MRQKIRGYKLTMLGAVLVSLISQGASAADAKVESLIKKNGLDNTRVLSMYQNGGLQLQTETPNKLILVNPKVRATDENAAKAM